MLFAKIVLGLAVEGPFDYIVPSELEKKISIGTRVYVNLRNSRMLGFVVGLSHKTKIRNLKKILEIIDDFPILDKNMLSLTKALSEYYCCSWGQAIETALPASLRKGKRLLNNIENSIKPKQETNPQSLLIHDLGGMKRWDIYLEQIKEALNNNRRALILLPDKNAVLNAKKIIESRLNSSLGVLYRKGAQESQEWSRIKSGLVNIVIGSRSSVFAPASNLGLLIIDEEENSTYKQDQVPHYNAREVAFMRSRIENARFILGSLAPSLESFYLAKQNKISYTLIPGLKDFPEIKIIDMELERQSLRQKNIILSKYLEDSIVSTLNSKGKVLLFLNRKGFATLASCSTCGLVLKCPRCNINLVYHFKENELNCHYCNFRIETPKICPDCNSGYIKFSGTGTEKIESELSRIFAQAKVKVLEPQDNSKASDVDIFVATSAIIKRGNYNFALTGVLGIDNSLNRIDLRSSEKAFALLMGLSALTEAKLIIQTALPHYACFQSLVKKDINIFYEEELKQRKELHFPPYKHMILVKLRAKADEKVKQASFNLFERLKESNKGRGVRIISVNRAQPPKLRDNYYWQILISSSNVKKASAFLKKHLKDFSHSGIIVTVDVDPL